MRRASSAQRTKSLLNDHTSSDVGWLIARLALLRVGEKRLLPGWRQRRIGWVVPQSQTNHKG